MAQAATSADPEANPTTTSQHWHPKPTPFRFLILSTTIGLGIAKAYAVSQDLSLVATTVEWVTGVALFSLIFILSLFESAPPFFLSWFFKSDIIQIACKTLALAQPQYLTDETPDSQLPLITGYRLLTSLLVTSFGVAKAYLVSQNLSPAANAVDWTLGIFILSFLYVLGLYEDNPVNLMPYLFSTNYKWLVDDVIQVIIYVTWMYLCFLWIRNTFEVTLNLLLILGNISSRQIRFWDFIDSVRGVLQLINGYSLFHRSRSTFQRVFLRSSLPRRIPGFENLLRNKTFSNAYETVIYMVLFAAIPLAFAALCTMLVIGLSKIVLLFESVWIVLFWNLLMSPVLLFLVFVLFLTFLGFVLSVCWCEFLLVGSCLQFLFYLFNIDSTRRSTTTPIV